MNLPRLLSWASLGLSVLLTSCYDPYYSEPTVWSNGGGTYGNSRQPGRVYPQDRYGVEPGSRPRVPRPNNRVEESARPYDDGNRWERRPAEPPHRPAPEAEEESPAPPRREPPKRVEPEHSFDPDNDPLVERPRAEEELPFGKEVKGRPGLLESPYDKNAPYSDAKGLPSGTKIKCPTTGKVFRVP